MDYSGTATTNATRTSFNSDHERLCKSESNHPLRPGNHTPGTERRVQKQPSPVILLPPPPPPLTPGRTSSRNNNNNRSSSSSSNNNNRSLFAPLHEHLHLSDHEPLIPGPLSPGSGRHFRRNSKGVMTNISMSDISTSNRRGMSDISYRHGIIPDLSETSSSREHHVGITTAAAATTPRRDNSNNESRWERRQEQHPLSPLSPGQKQRQQKSQFRKRSAMCMVALIVIFSLVSSLKSRREYDFEIFSNFTSTANSFLEEAGGSDLPTIATIASKDALAHRNIDERGVQSVVALGENNMLTKEEFRPATMTAMVNYTTNNANRSSIIHLQLDIGVPTFQRDQRLYQLAGSLRVAMETYKKDIEKRSKELKPTQRDVRIAKFRLLVTRFSEQERNESSHVQQTLANMSGLSSDNIRMIIAPSNISFSRALARNMVHQNACKDATLINRCLMASLDVDMIVKVEYFHHLVKTVYLRHQPKPVDPVTNADQVAWMQYTRLYSHPPSVPVVYFPIVWSEYNPASVVLVEKHFQQNNTNYTLPPFSEHRGLWRPFGKGQYVMMGRDAPLLQMDTSFVGWGGEDKAFFNDVNSRRRIFRLRETGLIHVWHDKDCNSSNFVAFGNVGAQKQMQDCIMTTKRQDGSELGQQLLELERSKNASLLETSKNVPSPERDNNASLPFIQRQDSLVGEGGIINTTSLRKFSSKTTFNISHPSTTVRIPTKHTTSLSTFNRQNITTGSHHTKEEMQELFSR